MGSFQFLKFFETAQTQSYIFLLDKLQDVVQIPKVYSDIHSGFSIGNFVNFYPDAI